MYGPSVHDTQTFALEIQYSTFHDSPLACDPGPRIVLLAKLLEEGSSMNKMHLLTRRLDLSPRRFYMSFHLTQLYTLFT